MVDELGDLDFFLAPYRGKIAREEQLRKKLRAEYAEKPGDQDFEIAGSRFVAFLGMRAIERWVNVQRLAKHVPLKMLTAIAGVTLKALEEAKIAGNVQAICIQSTQTGSRSLKVLPKGQPAA